ncbi:hypothetical protein KQI42_15840 [Tissierella sp. MSJ-40]|uniref:Uncharacterized protein n=1 Tax=Tissierella simiarum TaxID=2841534 RepID=A0ABS6E983_9FIRM|nr:hypothetical protein [Tissierella simiarum]MBU5439487.1 hypothetical protein [Tissierella simiarum]
MRKGYYLNDHKEGLSWWEDTGIRTVNNGLILELRSKPIIGEDGQKFYRRRLFFWRDIGKKIFSRKEEAIKNSKRI